eukprot:1403219-Prymnesium_polylepis.1
MSVQRGGSGAPPMLVFSVAGSVSSCYETCATSGDGVCNDGALGAEDSRCSFGTDCRDCGARPPRFQCSGPATSGALADSLWGAAASYDPYTRPLVASKLEEWQHNQGDSGFWPVAAEDVWLQMELLSVSSVDVKKQQLEIEVYLRVVWHDWRLAFNNSLHGACFRGGDTEAAGWAPFPASLLPSIWHPTVYVENMVGGEEKVLDAQFYLSPAGRVWHWRKAFWKLACKMDFTNMPRDVQHCFARMSTAAYGAGDIKLRQGLGADRPPVGVNYKPCLSVGGESGWFVTSVGDNSTISDTTGAGGSSLTDLR